MAGNLIIKRIIGFVFISSLFISCETNDKINQKIIKDNFLKIVDTMVVYKYGSFRPIPPLREVQENSYYKYHSFSVTLKDSISYNYHGEKDIEYFFYHNTLMKDDFIDLYKTGRYSKFLLDVDFPKKIGKYHISFTNSGQYPEIKYAGHVNIKNFKFSDSIGYLLVEESEKSSLISFIVLFKKINGKWEVIKREPLYET